LICIVAVMAYGLAAAQTLSGVYRTDFNELTLTQNGNRVTGTYKHQNGRLEGTLVGNTLTGWWYQDNGKGRLEFVFNADFSAFEGKWGYNDATPTGKWNGKRVGGGQPISAPNVTRLNGVYNTDFNELTITQTGNSVTGTYKYQNGRIEGTLNGNVLTGWWYQDNGKGRFEFVFNADFSAFEGRWGYNDVAPTGKWNGTKIR